MRTRKNRCAHCNAPLPQGTSSCAYCDLSSEGADSARSAPAKEPRRFTGRTILKLSLGLVGLTCCGPLGLFGTLYETVYAIKSDAPKFSARPPPDEQRRPEAIEPMQVFLDMRDASERSLSQRKQEWRERYEGRWVSWKGRVEEIRPYDQSYASELHLQPVDGQNFQMQVHFDPLHNARLNQLHKGQEVQVSGKLWGYYFMGDIVLVSEGALVEPTAPAQVQQSPL